MSETFAIRVPYGIKYTTTYPVPIDEIVDSLQALERILKRTPAFLEKAYDGIKVLETNVYVEKIESGSLLQKLIVEYVLNGKENHEEVKRLAAKIAKESPVVRNVVLVAATALVTYGAMSAIQGGEPSTHVEAHNSVILNAGGDINLSTQDIQELLDKVSDKKTLAKEAVAVTRPAKGDDQATIQFEGMPNLTIPAEAISEIPGDYQPPVPLERKVNYESVILLVDASDRHKRSGGWGGSAPGITSSRKPFSLNDAVDPEEVHGRTRIKADIVVHERFVKTKKEYQIHSIEIMKVYPPEG